MQVKLSYFKIFPKKSKGNLFWLRIIISRKASWLYFYQLRDLNTNIRQSFSKIMSPHSTTKPFKNCHKAFNTKVFVSRFHEIISFSWFLRYVLKIFIKIFIFTDIKYNKRIHTYLFNVAFKMLHFMFYLK